MKLTGEEHSILGAAAGLGYGPKPNHIVAIEVYGYAGAHRGSIQDVRAETLSVLKGLESRGLVRQVDSEHWETTPQGESEYGATFPHEEDKDPVQIQSYQQYLQDCERKRVQPASFLDWAWFNYFVSLDKEKSRA